MHANNNPLVEMNAYPRGDGMSSSTGTGTGTAAPAVSGEGASSDQQQQQPLAAAPAPSGAAPNNLGLPPIMPQMSVRGQAASTPASSTSDGGGQNRQNQQQQQQQQATNAGISSAMTHSSFGGSQMSPAAYQQQLMQMQNQAAMFGGGGMMGGAGGMMVSPNMNMYAGMGGIGMGGGFPGMSPTANFALQQQHMEQMQMQQQMQQQMQMAAMMQQKQMMAASPPTAARTEAPAEAQPQPQAQAQQPSADQQAQAAALSQKSQIEALKAETEALQRRLEAEETRKRMREEQAAAAASKTQQQQQQQQQQAEVASQEAAVVTQSRPTSQEEQMAVAVNEMEKLQRRLEEETRAATLQLRIEEEELRKMREALLRGQTIQQARVDAMVGSRPTGQLGAGEGRGVVPEGTDLLAHQANDIRLMPPTANMQQQQQPESSSTTQNKRPLPLPQVADDSMFATTQTPAKPRKKHASNQHHSSSKTKQSAQGGGPVKKRRPGRPLGSSTRAKKHFDSSLLLPSSLLDLEDLRPSKDFTMSPEMAASILASEPKPRKQQTLSHHTECWVDPAEDDADKNKKKSSFIMPCSREPNTIAKAPLVSYRNQWNRIQTSLEQSLGREPVEDMQWELVDRFIHDTRFGRISILKDASVTGKYGVNSQDEVLKRMEDRGYITRRNRRENNVRDQATTSATVAPAGAGPTTMNKSPNKPAEQGAPDRSHEQASSSESKIDYLTATPNLMMLPLEQRASHPRSA